MLSVSRMFFSPQNIAEKLNNKTEQHNFASITGSFIIYLKMNMLPVGSMAASHIYFRLRRNLCKIQEIDRTLHQ